MLAEHHGRSTRQQGQQAELPRSVPSVLAVLQQPVRPQMPDAIVVAVNLGPGGQDLFRCRGDLPVNAQLWLDGEAQLALQRKSEVQCLEVDFEAQKLETIVQSASESIPPPL